MARKWTQDEADQVRGLLQSYNDADAVCAVMDCKPEELDGLCRGAFGLGFEDAAHKYACIGDALLRKTLMQTALDGNPKSLDTMARKRLGTDPVASRRKAAKDADQGEKLEL